MTVKFPPILTFSATPIPPSTKRAPVPEVVEVVVLATSVIPSNLI